MNGWFIQEQSKSLLPMCILFTLSALNSIENYYHIEFRMDNDTTVVGSHQQQRWDKLQERGEPPGQVVQWQQSLSECGEDKWDCCWLQESALSACSSAHQWCDRGESEQHQVPGCTHHRGPLLDQQHCSTGQERTAASLLPPQTQKSQSPGPPSCAPSTEAPSRASWLAASLCGMAPATRPAARPSNG